MTSKIPIVAPSPPIPISDKLTEKLNAILEALPMEEMWKMIHRIIISYTYKGGSRGRREYYAKDIEKYLDVFGIEVDGIEDPDLFTDTQLEEMFGDGFKGDWSVVKDLLGRMTNMDVSLSYTKEMDNAVRELLVSVHWE